MQNLIRVFVLISILILAGCGGRNSASGSDSGITFDVSPESNQVGQTVLKITMTAADGSVIDDAALSVKGDMTHAGMQPVLADVTVFEDGSYFVPFEWTMSGDWFLTIDATLADGTQIIERVDGFEISE